MPPEIFAGDKKAKMVSPLAAVERRFIDENWEKFPPWLEGWHLTLLTIAWSMGMVLFGSLAARSLAWLWLSSLMIVAQWFTDCFDGALGRGRDRGLVRWGYYMDHLLDFVFMGCLVIGYAMFADGPTRTHLFFYMLLQGGLWVNSFLEFACTNEFRITHYGLGPTEIRLGFVILNTAIIIGGAGVLGAVIPVLNVVTLATLCLIAYNTQRRIWEIDMEVKRSE